MKLTSLLLISGSLLSTAAFAQAPVITSANNYAIGDKQITLVADSVGIEPGAAGANVTWDFSKLKQDSTLDSSFAVYRDPQKTSYASDFPKATIAAQDTVNGGYEYFNQDVNKIEFLGEAAYDSSTATDEILPLTNGEIQRVYPLTYGTTSTDSFSGNTSLLGFTLYIKGTISTKADGYGTLKIRNANYNNVLRVYSKEITEDSIYLGVGIGSTLVQDTSISYTYMVAGKKSPILTIVYDNQSQDSIPEGGTKSVSFNDIEQVNNSGFAAITANNISLGIFPNPGNGAEHLTINALSPAQTVITVTDQLGKTVQQLDNVSLMAGHNNLDLNLQGVPAGVYTVTMVSGQNMTHKQLVLR